MKKILEIIKRNILLIILIFIVIVLAFIYSYDNLFKRPIDNKELYVINNIELKSNDLNENKKLIIDNKETKLITMNIKNNYNIDKRFYIWYKISNNQDSINIGSASSSDIILSKDGNIIKKQSNQNLTIGIINNSNNPVEIEFGITTSDKNEVIETPNNTNVITNIINISKLKEYSIGEKITLKNNSSWYVIEESSSTDDYITLLKDNIINIKNDNQSLDIKNNLITFDPNDDNIKFYLENTYKKELETSGIKIGEQGEIRLINLNELLTIGNYNHQDYNYYNTSSPKWLILDTPWWTSTPFSKDSTYYVYKENIFFAKDKKTTRAALRPVIKVLKSNIKS